MGQREGVGPGQAEAIAKVVKVWERSRKIDLVCEGGGVLGVALAGAYSVLEARDYRPQNLVGTSAGSFVATLIAAGYTAEELRRLSVGELDFPRLLDPVAVMQVPLLSRTLVGKTLAILWHHGLYRGDELHTRIRELLGAKGVTTFRELLSDPEEQDPRYRYNVHVMVSDVTGRQLLRLPMDAGQLGATPDELPVADAVRMSTSIPLFFTLVRRYYGERRPLQRLADAAVRDHVLVDGGMLSNYPIRFLDSDDQAALPEWPAFGLRLAEPEPQGGAAERLPIPFLGTTDAGRLVNYLRYFVGAGRRCRIVVAPATSRCVVTAYGRPPTCPDWQSRGRVTWRQQSTAWRRWCRRWSRPTTGWPSTPTRWPARSASRPARWRAPTSA